MNDKNSNAFDSAVELFRKTAEDTAHNIEPAEAALFVDLSNDAFDIAGAVLKA